MNAVVELVSADIGTALGKPLPTDAANARKANACLTLVESMVVESQMDYDMALDEVKDLKAAWQAMEDDRTSFTVPLNLILDKINGRFQPHLKTLKAAETIIKAKMTGFLDRQAALQAEAVALAEKAAAAERERAQAEAMKLREQAAAMDPESAARVEEQASALEQTAAVVIAQPAFTAPSRGKGVSTPKTLDYEVEDKLALLKFIVNERPDLVVLVAIDDKPMKGFIKMMGLLTKLPGIKVFPKTGLTIR